MIENWLKEQKRKTNLYSFNVVDISEKTSPEEDIFNYLGKETITAYRNIGLLKREYKSKSKEELIKYINDYVFPSESNAISNGEARLRKNVKQGDFGEILTMNIIEKFRGLEVPIYKLRWKFNNNRSTFCTDIFAHNRGEHITDLRYYEVKTRKTYVKQLGVQAHNSLKNDIPNEYIADFLQRYYYEFAEAYIERGFESEANKCYEISDKYGQIRNYPKNYTRTFEIVLLLEKSKYKENILEMLHTLPPSIEPLEVTVILISNIKSITEKTYEKAFEHAMNIVYE